MKKFHGSLEMNSIKPSGVGSELNFSDVIDVIEQDPDYLGARPRTDPVESRKPASAAEAKVINRIESAMLNTGESVGGEPKHRARVEILEQPASKALRFRYEVEGRSAGSIPGANSTPENKTYPAVQVVGYRGKAVVVVSCVTKDFPYKPHPHNLVGKEGCKKGVCTLEINNDNMICTFSNLGIQCVKKKGIEESLKLREEIRVDPFHTGFAHKNQAQNIDLSAVRLCFQVFLEGSQKGKFTLALKPVVSEPIYDKKAMCDLTICKLSDCNSPVSGGKEIIMLCDKVAKNDVEIVFFHEEDGRIIWEGYGEFTASDVHRQVAISFRTPRYKLLDVEEPVHTYIQLRRPSDKECSEPRPFQFLPMDSGSFESLEASFSDIGALFANKRFKPDLQLYTRILAIDAAVLARRMFHASADEDKSLNNAAVQCDYSFDSIASKVTIDSSTQVGSGPELNRSLVPTNAPSTNVVGNGKVEIHEDCRELPPPLPEKGVSFSKLKGNLIKPGSGDGVPRNTGKSVNFDRSSLVTIVSESGESDARLSVASSEDLNSRLSAAFSDYSDVTDIRSSIAESEVDVNDALSLISSTHTLNDRLSMLSEASDLSDSDETVIETDGIARSETGSIDTIEKQLEMLELMSVEPPNDNQTYSSFQMAMRHPVWPINPTALPPNRDLDSNCNQVQTAVTLVDDDLVYDDPDPDPDHQPLPVCEDIISPTVPPRVESMGTPPLPPRRFKKLNQPLPELPTAQMSRDLGLKNALQVLKQTFKKSKPVISSSPSSKSPPLNSSMNNDGGGVGKELPMSGESASQDSSTLVEQKLEGSASDTLTEAENFALYMSLAPLATASEFDDSETLSMLYADLAPTATGKESIESGNALNNNGN